MLNKNYLWYWIKYVMKWISIPCIIDLIGHKDYIHSIELFVLMVVVLTPVFIALDIVFEFFFKRRKA